VATPLEITGAYTIFANRGQYVGPRFILAVNDAAGRTLWRSPVETRPVLDPRVSYLMVSLMQSVVDSGTGAGVRSRGFTLPAAGKTGTSHDGWFAGFTSNLLAVVWVGYDDDRELRLSGAASALPVWTEFMKRATQVPAYQDTQPFSAPEGIVTVPIDSRTNLVASAESPVTRNEVFIAGTEPAAGGRGGGASGILSRIFQSGATPTTPASATTALLPLPAGAPPPSVGGGNPPSASVQTEPLPEKKKQGGVVRKFLSIFKGKDSAPLPQPPPPKKAEP
jgi:penicillin-binding protein 1B